MTKGTDAQKTVKLYPSVLRVQLGKSKTITAAAYDVNRRPVFDAPFAFTMSDKGAVASLSPVLVSGDDLSVPLPPPPNLRTVTGISAGTTIVRATWDGITSHSVSVIVDDPSLPPVAVISGDNDDWGGTTINTRVGEAIEINAESSQGVDKIEWSWGDGDRTTDLLSATHAYLNAGTYALELRVSNSSGQMASRIVTVNVTPQSLPTQVITVNTIPELLFAYNNATGGEHIVIPAGTVLAGEIELPARVFTDYVTIRSSAAMPDLKDRISPSHPGLVTIRGTYTNAVPLTIKKGASKIRLVGIKFDPKYLPESNGSSTYYLAQIGEAFSQTDVTENPSKIILEHCVINPPDDVSVVHGVLNDGYKVSIISSWLGNIRTLWGQDSQAVVSYDGRGAHVYNNNFFEAASENMMYGGVVPKIDGLTSSNIEIRRCHFFKRPSWRVFEGDTHPLNVKNLFETKNARRIYMEGSVLENHWDAGRSQLFALVFKSSPSPGSVGEFVPWAISEDIVLENNKVSHIYGGVTTAVDNYYLDRFHGLKPNNIILKNNLFDDLSGRYGRPGEGDDARFLQPNSVEDLRVDHNTVIDRDSTSGTGIVFVTNNNFRLTVKNSIFGIGRYGIFGSSVGSGILALNPGTQGVVNGCVRDARATWDLRSNVMPLNGTDPSCYPKDGSFRNYYPSNYDGVGFADLANSDYRLSASSVYKGAGDNGSDPGANITLLNQRTGCTVSGRTSNCVGGASNAVFSVRLRVTDTNGRPVSNSQITMRASNGQLWIARTNPFGYCTILDVVRGEYTFALSGRGRAPALWSMFLDEYTSMIHLTAN